MLRNSQNAIQLSVRKWKTCLDDLTGTVTKTQLDNTLAGPGCSHAPRHRAREIRLDGSVHGNLSESPVLAPWRLPPVGGMFPPALPRVRLLSRPSSS